LTNQKCKYHQDQDAISKCEDCGALVCLECKNIYRPMYSTNHSRRRYGYRYELCPECYAERLEKTKNPFSLIFITVFIAIFLGVASQGLSDAPGGFTAMFIIVPVFMLGSVGYYYFIKFPQMREDAKQRRNKALVALSKASSYKPEQSSNKKERSHKTTDSTMFCQQCGHPLDPNENFCSNCGDTTADEKKNQGSNYRYDSDF